MLLYSLIVFAVYTLNSVHCQDLPSYVKSCPRDAENYLECLKQIAQLSWNYVTTVGIPEEKMAPMDPLVVDRANGTVKLSFVDGKFDFPDMKTIGLSNAKIISATPKGKGNHFRVDLLIDCPELALDGEYVAGGDFGFFSVQAKGHMHVRLTDVKLGVMLDGRNINDTWAIKRVSISVVMSGLEITATDELSDSGFLFRTAVGILNNFWKLLYPPVAPLITEPIGEVVKDYMTKAFANVPFSKAFP